MAQKGNDLHSLNQNLKHTKAQGQHPRPQQPKPNKIPEVTPQNPYRKSTQRLSPIHQDPNIFQTGTEATTRGVNKTVVSDTGGQITFNQGTVNGGSFDSAGGRTGKRCIFVTGSEFGGMTDLEEGGLVGGGGDSVIGDGDVWGKDEEVLSRGVGVGLERSSSIIYNSERLQGYRRGRVKGDFKGDSKMERSLSEFERTPVKKAKHYPYEPLKMRADVGSKEKTKKVESLNVSKIGEQGSVMSKFKVSGSTSKKKPINSAGKYSLENSLQ